MLHQGYSLWAADSTQTCRVMLPKLAGTYKGDCKKGLANGAGEAIGLHHYTGQFKNGMPNGKGTYHFHEDQFYTCNFQDGVKEGKGEMHYLRYNVPDSIVKGFWSGDEFRGKYYNTYSFRTSETFDSYEIIPSDQNGNSVTIDISTTTGSPDGTAASLTGRAKTGFVLSLTDITATNDIVIREILVNKTTTKSSYTYLLSKFPANLLITLSNNRIIELDLYKAAKWDIRLFLNK
jgi:hypothetical protein